MRSIFTVITLMLTFSLVACGRQEQAKPFQGVSVENKNYLKEGMQLLSQGNVRMAIQSFDAAIKKEPNDVNNYLVLGQVYVKLKDFNRAVDTFSAATRIDPRSGEAQYMLALSLSMSLQSSDPAEYGPRHQMAVSSAKRSLDIFLADKNEDKFRRSVVLIQSLTDTNQTQQPEIEITQDIQE